jgi:hypothetical protein
MTARNLGWCTLIVLVVLGAMLNLIACIVAVARGNVFVLARAAVGIVCAYWIVVGAWRRTTWGLVVVDTDERGPVLDEVHSRRLILTACAVPIVLTLALAAQVVAGR